MSGKEKLRRIGGKVTRDLHAWCLGFCVSGEIFSFLVDIFFLVACEMLVAKKGFGVHRR